MLVRMIIIDCNHRHHTDQQHRLPQDVRNSDIVRIRIVGIQRQNGALHPVHDIRTRCFHDDIPDKLARKLAVLSQKIDEITQLFPVRQLAEQQQIGDLLKIEPVVPEPLYQIRDLVALVVQLALDRNRLPVNIPVSVHV